MASKPPKSRSFRDLLVISVNLAADALDRFELYNCLKTPTHRKDYAVAFASYPLFFDGVIRSVFESFVLILYKLGEKRKDTVHIERLIKEALSAKVIDEIAAAKLRAQFEEEKPIWIKVATLRNKIIGHTTHSLSVRQVLIEAALTPAQLEKLAAIYAEILNTLAVAIKLPPLKHQSYSQKVAIETAKLLARLSS